MREICMSGLRRGRGLNPPPYSTVLRGFFAQIFGQLKEKSANNERIAPPTIEAGQQELSVTVHVVFALQP